MIVKKLITYTSIAILYFSLLILEDNKTYGQEYNALQVYGAVWCPPCQKLKNDLKSSKKLKDFVQQKFWKVYNIDVSNDMEERKIDRIPLIKWLVWNKEEKKWIVKKRIVGYTNPENFMSLLEKVENE